MSGPRYFDSIPHAIRFAMQDDQNHKGNLYFCRAGVHFTITISRADILGTRFEKKWTELNREYGLTPWNHDEWSRHQDMLNECIISQCLDLLGELAPDRDRWATLKDYIHTPAYTIKMVADEQSGDAKGVVVGGTEISKGLWLGPLPEEEVAIDFHGLPRYRSEDLFLVGETETRFEPPCRVRTPEGNYFGLECIDEYACSTETGEWSSGPLDVIRARIKVQEHCVTHHINIPARIPHVLGYITDDTVPSEGRRWRRSDGEEILIEPDSEPQSFIAGVLLTDFPIDARTLNMLVFGAQTDPAQLAFIKDNQKTWRSQALAVVNELHAKGMACGYFTSANRPRLDMHTINVDHDQTVWLDPRSVIHFVAPAEVGPLPETPTSAFDKARKEDLDGVYMTFDQWLPDELGKIQAAENNEVQ